MKSRSSKLLFTPADGPDTQPAHFKSANSGPPMPSEIPPAVDLSSSGDADDEAQSALPVFLSTKQVARMFNRTPRTIRTWEAKGLLKPIRKGRSVFYRQSDFDDLGW